MSRLVPLLFVLCTASEIACAYEPAVDIYDQVLSKVAEYNQTNKIAVYFRPIRPEQLVMHRVGRHEPNRQISRAIPSVPADLEYDLLFETEKYYRIDSSDPYSWVKWTNPNGDYYGVVGANDFAGIRGVTVVQLGTIAINSDQTTALVYAESTWINSEGSSLSASAYAFVFKKMKTEKRWSLSDFSLLWMGGEPFLMYVADY